MDIKLDGVRELRKGLKDVRDQFPEEMKAIHGEIADRTYSTVMQRVPRRSGALAGVITPGATKTVARVQMNQKKVPYGGILEYGDPHRNRQPKRFLVSSHEDLKESNLELYRDRVQQLLDKTDFGL